MIVMKLQNLFNRFICFPVVVQNLAVVQKTSNGAKNLNTIIFIIIVVIIILIVSILFNNKNK